MTLSTTGNYFECKTLLPTFEGLGNTHPHKTSSPPPPGYTPPKPRSSTPTWMYNVSAFCAEIALSSVVWATYCPNPALALSTSFILFSYIISLCCFRIVSSFILEGKGLRTTGSSSEPLWSMEKMQAYFCYIKTLKPQLTPESNRLLEYVFSK